MTDNYKKKWLGHFFGFLSVFFIGARTLRNKYLTFLDIYILVKRLLENLHLHPQWGLDTYNDTHKTGAAHKAAQPIFCEERPS